MLTKRRFWLVQFDTICQSHRTWRIDNFKFGTCKAPLGPLHYFCDWIERRRVCMTEARVLCYSGIPSSHSPVASLHPTLSFRFNSTRSRHGPTICSSLLFNIPRTSNRSRHWLFLLASLARRRLGPGMCTWVL